MGQGIDLARDGAPMHAAVLDDFKDQLIIVLLKRLGADKDGGVVIPLAEMDDTGNDLCGFCIEDDPRYERTSKQFRFKVTKKS